MKIKLGPISIALSALTIVLITGFAMVSRSDNSLVKKQEKLAQELGVALEDYPPTSPFPENYFRSALKPGMSKQEVHSIVNGYEQVFTCNKNSRELYYYYDTEEKKALRFVVFYDIQFQFDKLQGISYDDDPHLVIVDKETCVPGLREQ